MQKIIENGITVLSADDGMRLTDGSSFVSTVRLGKEDDGNGWTEITEAEAERRIEAMYPSDEADMATEEDYQTALRELGVDV